MRDLGRYVAHHALGRGGTATVYFGTMTGPSGFVRRVAIKELHAIIASDPQLRSMLTEEARISGRIMHPNTVPVLDMVEHDGQAFAIMDYVHGATVFELLRAARARRGDGPWSTVFPLGVAVAIGADVLSGLAAAHAAKDVSGKSLGVIHRDISPDNVLVGMDGVARLTDFGIARAEGRAVKTESGVVKGKFRYMAPEQAAGEATQASDLFSMGVVLFELLTGDRLFDAEHEAGVLNQVLSKQITTVSAKNPAVPTGLSEVVARALSREPSERFPTAAAMGDAWRAAAPRHDQQNVQVFMTGLVGDSLREKLERVEAAEQQAEAIAHAAGAKAQPGARSDEPPPGYWEEATTIQDGPRTRTAASYTGALQAAPISDTHLAARSDGAEPTRLTFEAEPVVRRGPPRRLVIALGVPMLLMFGVIVYAASSSSSRDRTGAKAHDLPERERGASTVTSVVSPPSPLPPDPFPAIGVAVSSPPPSVAPSAVPTPPAASTTQKQVKRPVAEPDCRTPFYIDNQGVRVYRRECLQ